MLDSENPVDVLVIGFGPVGAALAGLLGRRGITVLVLEREEDVFPLPRAAHVDHTGLRVWQELGVLDVVLPAMRANAGLDFLTAKGELLARIPGDRESLSGLPTSMYFYQPTLDRQIRQVVSAMPSVEVRLATEVVEVKDEHDHVEVVAVDRAGQRTTARGKWLVACDGAGSPVREQLGMELKDIGFDEPWLVVDVKVEESLDKGSGAVCLCDPRRPTYSIPMPSHRQRFEFRMMESDDPAELVESTRVEELVEAWLPPGSFSRERAAIYTFHGLVAKRWRHGHVFLAGDAAHQMPPFLGQGMCSGLRDASNLTWKLDLVLRGVASERILDTYEEERRAHVGTIVDAAVSIGRVISTVDPDEAAARDLRMLGDSRPPSQRLAFALPPLSGSLVRENGGDLFIQPSIRHRPRLDDLIGPRFAVLARNRETLGQRGAAWWGARLNAFISTVDELPVASASAVRAWLDSHASDVVVVRPDHYVLWAGSDLDALTQEIAEMFGDDLPVLMSG